MKRQKWLLVLLPSAFCLLTCHREPPPRYNVLLITLDTFRADRLGAETPNLMKLAAGGVRFDNADAPVPLTLPAHCSLLSGVLPLHHGVRNNGANPFPSDRDTLATIFSGAGYRTGAFVSSFVLDRRFGLSRGFDLYDDDIPRDPANEANTLEAERRGEVTVDRALTWLRGSGTKPFFAWVHLYDAHAPYAPPPPFPQTYDGEIAYVDAQVGRLLSAIDLDRTIVAVVGDHGEALGEHGELTHGLLLYEPTLHVPLVIHAPGIAARAFRTALSTVDLAPTLAAVAGVKLERTDGRAIDLTAEPAESSVYAETEYPLQFGWNDLASVRRGSLKLISNRELYELDRDPAEKSNVLTEQRHAFHELDEALKAVQRTAAGPAPQVTVDEETRRKLASLGYVAPAGTTTAGGEKPDAVKMAPLFRRFEEATWALNGGRAGEAIDTFRELVARDRSNPVFRESLARALRGSGRLDEAIQLYREAVAMSPASAENWYNLAVALQESGHTEEAGVAVREAIRRDSKRPEAHNALGVAYTADGKPKEAEEEFRTAIRLDPHNARAWNNLGNVLRDTNQFDPARDAYQHAIALSPRYPDPLNGLGVLDVQQDHPREAIAEFDAALRIAPAFYEAQLNRGIALRVSGDLSAATEQFRHLLSTLPPGHDYDAQRNAARALLSR